MISKAENQFYEVVDLNRKLCNIFIGISLLTTLVFSSAVGQIAKTRLQFQAIGGVFSPVEEEMQNVYGSSSIFQLNLVAAMNEQSRLKIGASHFQSSGNPFYSLNDFLVGDVATLSMNSLSLMLELGGKATHNPKVYVGAGVIYYFGSENIEGVGKNGGDGLGGMFSLSPEFQLSNHVFLVMEAALRLVEVKFRDNNRRYTFNLTGGTLSLGIAYKLGSP